MNDIAAARWRKTIDGSPAEATPEEALAAALDDLRSGRDSADVALVILKDSEGLRWLLAGTDKKDSVLGLVERFKFLFMMGAS